MTRCKTSFEIQLPGPEAADLALQAAKEGVSTIDLIVYLVIRSAFGLLHPMVTEYETRPKLGQVGPKQDAE
ncbi:MULTISPECIES: hypothetical protein [Paraburkholderia]|uniref:hypothetical protein n=1 Tax=Paraburkholderia TaxID=1822464 RepID=UPI002255223F|nr:MULTISPECIES: hypothetical protein [Paraburkholderia]MCX4154969.1 hypothetical protein [Paraburkholderia aspalathi]MDN7164380.1 hypothetical protein [Paraburkholderia sp. SECH2]MDQ6392865.1 hypothetical protein [Paraburkholderia aspalathi]